MEKVSHKPEGKYFQNAIKATLTILTAKLLDLAVLRHAEYINPFIVRDFNLEFLRDNVAGIVALGNNWMKTGISFGVHLPPLYRRPIPNVPSLETKATAYATAVLAKELEVPVIFSTGKTAGPNGISEAQAMVEIIRRDGNIPRIQHYSLEMSSFSTRSNAVQIKRIARSRGFTDLLVITTSSHTFRTSKTFSEFEVPLAGIIASELILQNLRPDLLNNLGILGGPMEYFKEALMLMFDPTGKLSEHAARKRLTRVF